VGGGVGFRVDKEPNIIMNWTIGGEERGEDNNIHIMYLNCMDLSTIAIYGLGRRRGREGGGQKDSVLKSMHRLDIGGDRVHIQGSWGGRRYP
jgi:hypothetical protein